VEVCASISMRSRRSSTALQASRESNAPVSESVSFRTGSRTYSGPSRETVHLVVNDLGPRLGVRVSAALLLMIRRPPTRP